jgi:hypothetical protein
VKQRTLVRGIAFDAARFGSGTGCVSGTPSAPIFGYTTSTGVVATTLASVFAIDITLPVRTPDRFQNATTSAHTKVFLPNVTWGR